MATKDQVPVGAIIHNNEDGADHKVIAVLQRPGFAGWYALYFADTARGSKRKCYVNVDRIYMDGHTRKRGYNYVSGPIVVAGVPVSS